MAKQTLAEIKKDMGYESKPIVATCSNCEAFSSDMVTQNKGYGDWTSEKNLRCTFSNIKHFKVAKTGKCKHHEFKKDGENNV